MSKLVMANKEYREWITSLSQEFKTSQIRATIKVNEEMLMLYWKLGKDISSMSEKYGYGSDFYKMVSEDLNKLLPEIKSFSPTNLKYMRYFYELYQFAEIRPQVGDELVTHEDTIKFEKDFSII